MAAHENSPLVGGTSRPFSDSFMNQLDGERLAALESRPGVGPAAHLIRDAIIGKNTEYYYDPYSNPDNPILNAIVRLCGHIQVRLKFLEVIAYWGLMVVGLVEPPYWCRDFELDDGAHPYESGFGNCDIILEARDPTDASIEYYPNFGTMVLTIEQSIYAERLCILVLAVFLILRLGRNGFNLKSFFFREMMNGLRCSLLVFLYFYNEGYDPLFRLFLLATYLDGLHKELASVSKMIYQVVYIMIVLAIIVSFYSFAGVLLFAGSPQGEQDFPNFIEGCWTLWICITTANYPDVMMTSFNASRFSAIYFVSFMLISFFFLMNLILAAVVEGYDSTTSQRKQEERMQKDTNISKAFQLMDTDSTGSIDLETIKALFIVLNYDFPEIRVLFEEEMEDFFVKMDTDESHLVELNEFKQFGLVLVKLNQEPDETTFIQTYLPWIYNSSGFQKFCEVVNSTQFEQVIDTVLLINAIFLIIQSLPQLSGEKIEDATTADSMWESAETIFTAFYTFEVLAKVLVLGWAKYISKPRNTFDFVITVAVLMSTAYVYFPNTYDDNHLIQFIVMVRVARLGRVLMSFSPFRVIAAVSMQVLPRSKSIMQLLFFGLYLFASLGMFWYGGLITRDPKNPLSVALLDTDFADADYWANNFNDIMSGINVLFNLLVVNNWTECEIGFEAVTGSKTARLFFLSFHFFGVVLINNLVIAFILNTFFSVWEEEFEKEQSSTLTRRSIYFRFTS